MDMQTSRYPGLILRCCSCAESPAQQGAEVDAGLRMLSHAGNTFEAPHHLALSLDVLIIFGVACRLFPVGRSASALSCSSC